MNGGRSSWRSCRDSWVVRKVWLPVWAVLSCLLLAPSLMALAISPDRMNSLAASVAVPHRECPSWLGMEPRRSGLVYGRTAQWRGCRGLFGMVLAEKGGKPGKGKQFSRVACRKGRNRLPLSLVNDTAEVLKRGLGSFSASCLFPVTGLALGGGGTE